MPLDLDVVGLDSGKPFWQEYYISAVSFSVHHIGASDVHLSLIGDIKYNHFVKAAFAQFL